MNLIRDGDVAPAIAARAPETGVDLLYGIGGTPEGVISAAALKSVGGGIQGRLWPRDDRRARSRSSTPGYDLDRVLTTDDLVASDDVFVAATGVTTGALLRGVRYVRDGAITDSIVMRSRSGTVRRIEARHNLEKADAVHRKGVPMTNTDLDEARLRRAALHPRLRPSRLVREDGRRTATTTAIALVRGAKQLIWEGFQRAVEQGAPKAFAGILVDAQYGPDVARAGKAGGYMLAMPVEKSGQNEFDFEYGESVRREDRGVRPRLLEGARPLQPGRRRRDERAADGQARAALRVAARAATASTCSSCSCRPSRRSSSRVGGSADRYDTELRPELMIEAILQLQNGGRRARHLEDRGHRRPRGVRRDRAARAARGPRPRLVRRARPRRLRRQGRRVAARRRRPRGLHRLRDRPVDLLAKR